MILMPSEKDAPLITGSAAVPCLENVELSIPFFEQTDYQWYRDGVAIPGADNSAYTVPPGNDAVGNYLIR
jgi:hypothetical protein